MPSDRAAAPDPPGELFISYHSDDVARAERLHARLHVAGFGVWFDRARLAKTCDWHREIAAGCAAARLVLPLLTPRWQLSRWTKYETYAFAEVQPLLAEGTLADALTPRGRFVPASRQRPPAPRRPGRLRLLQRRSRDRNWPAAGVQRPRLRPHGCRRRVS